MVAVYPGSFDPITNGHIDIIQRSCMIFSKVIVAVANNSEKKGLFTPEERVEMIRETFQGNPKIEVVRFDGLLVKYAKDRDIRVIIRGLRAVSDFEYEFQMALTNRKLNSSIETVFIMAEDHVSYFSSSLVREIAKLGGDISSLVPPQVVKWFKKKQQR